LHRGGASTAAEERILKRFQRWVIIGRRTKKSAMPEQSGIQVDQWRGESQLALGWIPVSTEMSNSGAARLS
jgi:hypothetical protein